MQVFTALLHVPAENLSRTVASILAGAFTALLLNHGLVFHCVKIRHLTGVQNIRNIFEEGFLRHLRVTEQEINGLTTLTSADENSCDVLVPFIYTVILSDTNLIKKMIEFDKDNMKPEVIDKVRPFMDDPNFEPEVVKKGSVAAAGICKWIRAMVIYDRVAKVVGPKRAALKIAEAEAKEAKDKLDTAQKTLKEIIDNLKTLQQNFDEATQKQEDLQEQVTDCKNKLNRAEKLLGGLGGEKGRWSINVEALGVDYKNLTGDVLIASGFMAYLAVFTQAYRKESCAEWVQLLQECKIPCADEFDLPSVVGDQVKIRQWIIDKLPNDAVSVDNAITMENSKRWPLMIDPQIQGNKWVKNTYGDELRTLRLTQGDYARKLETAIQFGQPVLIENVQEALDPMLDPLLQKQFYKAGNLLMIRLGDATIEYSKEFNLFITTKLPNPHYAPEICVTVTVLNFVTTWEGLADGMLATLVAKENPEMEKKRVALVIESAESKAALKNIEDTILKLLSEASGNILDDEVLIDTLTQSKVTSNAIEEKVKIQEKTQQQINQTRAIYKPVADRSAALFFVVSDLGNVDPSYQYSLEWFVNIFLVSIDTAPQSPKKADRIKNLNADFIGRLYRNVCRSLFEKDKLLFSLLIAIKMLTFDNEVDLKQLKLLLVGGGGGGKLDKPKPLGHTWLTDVMWDRVIQMEKLGGTFERFTDTFEKDIAKWKEVFDAEAPLDVKWPASLTAKAEGGMLTFVEKGLVMCAIRSDCIVRALQMLIENKLGVAFLEPPSFDLAACYDDSKADVPMIFVLTMGADPVVELRKLANDLNVGNLEMIALGQGQGPKAKASIERNAENGKDGGGWVVLQNCHLATSFMPVLEALVEEFNIENMHSEFRLWLTTMPNPNFPVSVLQNGIKMTLEPPKGLKANIIRAYRSFDEEWFQQGCAQGPFRKLLFGLAFFHGLILSRRKFGPLGWNIQYQFSDPDRDISSKQLLVFLEEYEEVQYDALRYLAAECNYGGRVTDRMDRRLISTIIELFYCEGVVHDDKYKFSASGTYYAPPDTNMQGYMDFTQKLPLNETPECFHLHANADLTALINEGTAILSNAVSLMPRDSSAGGKTPEEEFCEIAAEIEASLPKQKFDVDAVVRKYPVERLKSMNTILPQECIRYNKLFGVVSNSVEKLQKAVSGLVVMTPELEAVSNSLLDNKVPDEWRACSYPTQKALGAYANDFVQRMTFMTNWINDDVPTVFWISGFFFTQAFLTGIKQDMARENTVAIDTIIWNFQFQKMAELQEVVLKFILHDFDAKLIFKRHCFVSIYFFPQN